MLSLAHVTTLGINAMHNSITRVVLAYTPATSYSSIINIIYYYRRRCAVGSLLCESYPARCAIVEMTFLRYILHWKLVNNTSTVERGLERLLSSHSTSCAVLSLLGKKPPHTWEMLGCGLSFKRYTTQCPVGIWRDVATLLRLRPVANWLLVLTIDNCS